MFLAVDIGNTSIKIGKFLNSILSEFYSFPDVVETINFLKNNSFNEIAIASVVNKKLETINNFLINRNISPYIISINSKYKFQIKYDTPDSLGIDRLCGLEGALKLSLNKNFDFLITIDCGTATTINVIDDKTFIGGLISPGLKTMTSSLHNNTAQLPEINLDSYNKIIGTSTMTAIASGVINSTLGMIEKVLKELNGDILLYLTGGNAKIITKLLKVNFEYIPELTLIGINSVYQNSKMEF